MVLANVTIDSQPIFKVDLCNLITYTCIVVRPCLINYLTNYVKKKVHAVKILVLRGHYNPLSTTKSMI